MRSVMVFESISERVLTEQQKATVVWRVNVKLKLDPPTESGETADVLSAAGWEDQI
jgi:hypothetical protein